MSAAADIARRQLSPAIAIPGVACSAPVTPDPIGATHQVGWVALALRQSKSTKRPRSYSASSPRLCMASPSSFHAAQEISVLEAQPDDPCVSSLGSKPDWKYLDGSQTKITTSGSSCASFPMSKFLHLEHFTSIGSGDTDIPTGLLQCKRLTHLFITGSHLNECLLPGNAALESLLLQANEITEIQNTQFFFFNLKILDLSRNQLTKLPDCMDTLHQLSVLVLKHNSFSRFPDQVVQLPSLTRLDVSSNQLGCIPDSIRNLTTLEMLDVSRNPMEKLPSSIVELPRLAFLRAVCAIRQFSPIEGMTRLSQLNISRNGFVEIPESIANLTDLTELNISHNVLRALPSTLTCLRNLQLLDVSDNRLTEIPEIKLKTLRISNNLLSCSRRGPEQDSVEFLIGSPQHTSPLSCSSLRSDLSTTPPFYELEPSILSVNAPFDEFQNAIDDVVE